jgi:hypothetical protein
MSSISTGKKYLSIPAWILIVAIMALGVTQSGNPANFVDPSGFLFVLVGGIALVMISFPGTEIWRALRDAVGTPGNEADIRGSALLWEAAGRGFWILGVLRSMLHLVMFFVSMKTQETSSIQWLIKELAQYLLATFYGILLAVICFIPCWKFMGKLPSGPLAPSAEQRSLSIRCPGWRPGVVAGYVLFFAVLVSCFLKVPLSAGDLIALKPALLLVLGGTIALMLFMRGANSGPTLSTAFAAMGFIGSLMGAIQMLFGMAEGTPGIIHVAGAFAFLVASCLTALLGMVLVGAPLDDHAIRTGRVPAPSVFSRVAWYVFPLLALIFLIPMILQLFVPISGPR